MNTYTYTEARQKLASLLEQAATYGEVRIKRRDGQVFVIKPEKREGSPLAVEGIKLGLSREEILQSIEEGRREIKIAAGLRGRALRLPLPSRSTRSASARNKCGAFRPTVPPFGKRVKSRGLLAKGRCPYRVSHGQATDINWLKKVGQSHLEF